MVSRIQSEFEQINEMIHNNGLVIDFLNNGGVVTVQETDKQFSIFAYPPQEAPIWDEVTGHRCTFIITKEVEDDGNWIFTIYKENHSDYTDPDYYFDNDMDCRNCKNFYLMHGNFYTCNATGKDIMDPLMEECYLCRSD